MQTGSSDNVDFVALCVALAQRLAETKRAIDASPEVQQLRANLQRLATTVQQSVAAIHLDPRVSDFLARVPEWHANWQANMLLVDRGMSGLKQSPYQAVWHLFRLSDVRAFADLSQEEIGAMFYEQTASQPFREELLQMYQRTPLPSGRLQLLREALGLHATRSFGGCVTMLYSQIEGIIGDALVLIGKATQSDDGTLKSVDGHRKLRGLEQKLDVAHAGVEDSIYDALLGECLLADSIAVRFAPSRNGVLHGSDLNFATQERSTQLVLWLAALLVSMSGDSRMARQ